MKKISIILPVYNVENYLDKCLTSLVNQTYQNLEIILVNDGSPDNSGEVCENWAKKDSRIKVLHKANGGVSSARNFGLDNATGDFIGFIDPDDFVELDMYEKLLNALNSQNATMAMCRYQNVFENSDRIQKVYEENLTNLNGEHQEYLLLNRTNQTNGETHTNAVMGAVWRCLFAKQIVQAIRFENVSICEDFIFVSDVLKKKPKIAVVDEYLYNYLQRTTSAMHKVDMKKIDSRVEATQLVYERMKDCVDKQVLSASMFNVYSFCIIKLSYGYKVKDIKEFANREYIKTMLNTKENYQAQKINGGFSKKIWYYLIHKKHFALGKLFLKFYKLIKKN